MLSEQPSPEGNKNIASSSTASTITKQLLGEFNQATIGRDGTVVPNTSGQVYAIKATKEILALVAMVMTNFVAMKFYALDVKKAEGRSAIQKAKEFLDKVRSAYATTRLQDFLKDDASLFTEGQGDSEDVAMHQALYYQFKDHIDHDTWIRLMADIPPNRRSTPTIGLLISILKTQLSKYDAKAEIAVADMFSEKTIVANNIRMLEPVLIKFLADVAVAHEVLPSKPVDGITLKNALTKYIKNLDPSQTDLYNKLLQKLLVIRKGLTAEELKEYPTISEDPYQHAAAIIKLLDDLDEIVNDRADDKKTVSALVGDEIKVGGKRGRDIDGDIQALINRTVEKTFKRFKNSPGKPAATPPPAKDPTKPATPRKEYTLEESKAHLIKLIKRKHKLKREDKDGSNTAAMRKVSNQIKGLKHIQLTEAERPKAGEE